jgi:hypothetical protein
VTGRSIAPVDRRIARLQQQAIEREEREAAERAAAEKDRAKARKR